MDIAERLTKAVGNLTDGDHTPGLNAVLRHVAAAIRHFERADGHDEDAYTDCIYRTNQVYEGSLKEAYRIISGNQPNDISLHEIERYFSEGNTLRHRVLEQMTRYRREYRNPSTHDYKLDFDENEALLAILSVVGFAILLIDQMRKEIERSELQSSSALKGDDSLSENVEKIDVFANELSTSIRDFLSFGAKQIDVTSWETSALVSAYLEKSGLETTRDVYIETEHGWGEWDVVVRTESNLKLPIEIKTSRGRQSREITLSRIRQVTEFAEVSEYDFALLIEGTANPEKYGLQRFVISNSDTQKDITIFRIGNVDNVPDLPNEHIAN